MTDQPEMFQRTVVVVVVFVDDVEKVRSIQFGVLLVKLLLQHQCQICQNEMSELVS